MSSSFVKRIFIRIASSLTDAFFPLKCQACGFFLRDSGIEKVLCDKCAQYLKSPESPMCLVCGKIFKSGSVDRKCGNCITDPPFFDSVRSSFFYEGPARKIVHALKYDGTTRLTGFMAKAICGLLTEEEKCENPLIVPVPLFPSKLRKRGFNQACLIADSMSSHFRQKEDNKHFCSFDLIERVKNTRTQAGLHKKERRLNVKNAFKVRRPEIIKGRCVILVDDVFTTGATVSECARQLKKAGASRVMVFTFARVRDL